MRLPHHLIRVPSGIYYFRMRVPADLTDRIGIPFIQVSLRTRSPQVAKVYSYNLSLRYAEAFAALRGTAMPKAPPSIESLLAAQAAGNLRRFELDMDPATLRPSRIRTNGTPEDNAAALEAIGMLTGSGPRVVFASPLPSRRSTPSMTLEAAIELYGQVEAPSLKPNTWAQRQRGLESFKANLGATRPVTDVTREDAGSWATGLIVGGLTKRTAGNVVSHVAQLFTFLERTGRTQGPNPVKGLIVLSAKEKTARRAAGFQWEAFDLPTLKRIFDPENFRRIRADHTRWAAVMGLYTGARVAEIAQLYLVDFVVEEGTLCLRIATDSDGQSVKTESSRRLVPIHPDLVRLGLLERVERLRSEGHQRLFPDMRIDSKAGAGNAISKGFGYYLDQLCIKPRRANGTVGFHSLRKTVIQELQGSKVPAERRRAFVGHEAGDDVHEAVYMRAWTAAELAELFPGLRWGEWMSLGSVRDVLRRSMVKLE
jgi:integrase